MQDAPISDAAFDGASVTVVDSTMTAADASSPAIAELDVLPGCTGWRRFADMVAAGELPRGVPAKPVEQPVGIGQRLEESDSCDWFWSDNFYSAMRPPRRRRSQGIVCWIKRAHGSDNLAFYRVLAKRVKACLSDYGFTVAPEPEGHHQWNASLRVTSVLPHMNATVSSGEIGYEHDHIAFSADWDEWPPGSGKFIDARTSDAVIRDGGVQTISSAAPDGADAAADVATDEGAP